MPEISDRELKRLKNAVNELSALNEIAGSINVAMSLANITKAIIDRCVKRLSASQGAIFLLNQEDPDDPDRFKTFIREIADTSGEIPIHLNASLTGWMIKNKALFVSNDPINDDRLRGVDFKQLGITSILAAPLLSRKGLQGVIALFNKQDGGEFDAGDKRFLGIVGTQAAQVIENAALFEQEKKLIAIEEDQKVARAIQQGFLPKENLELPDFCVVGVNLPAKEVSGDYYDMYQIDENRIFLSLGDVSGKGIPAALLMVCGQSVLRSHMNVLAQGALDRAGADLNRLITEFTDPAQYITLWYGLYDRKSRELAYVNAGHVPPLHIKPDGKIIELEGADLIVGALPEAQYTTRKIVLEPGDMVLVCTDGISEAFNEKEEEFGDERLHAVIKQHISEEVPRLAQEILNAIRGFRKRAKQSDDITLLLLKVTA